MPTNAELQAHRDWIGALQPVGLVVSAPALFAAGAFPDRNVLEKRNALLSLILPRGAKETDKEFAKRKPTPVRFPALAREVLGWKAGKLFGAADGPPVPESLDLVLTAFNETLRPTYAVAAPKEDEAEWLMLIQELPEGLALDMAPEESSRRWQASPQVRFERLLREKGVAVGILCNGAKLRLVYAPRGETSGHVTWPLYDLSKASYQEGLSALCMLLGAARLFSLPREQRLPHILKESRKYQNVVSTKLAGQVLEALNELLRGFQAANEVTKGELLDTTVRDDPDHIYGGLLAVLLRLVFVLYAEERGMLSSSETYVRNYALVGLFDKLRIDAGRFPDTMDQRYGAWSRLLVLFRMIHDGAKRGDFRLPARYGHLFDPDGWSFLEGRSYGINRTREGAVDVPKIPDGFVLRVLEQLFLLDSERLSYRALDVEQIGSVYENMMGFRLERAGETSIGVGKDHVVVGLETLLQKSGSERAKYLKTTTGVELSGKAAEALSQGASIDDLMTALNKRTSPLTPQALPAGCLFLQPTDERRRSGSHYTPRALTEPIVRTTLRPILEDLGPSPKPDQVLALRICDPSMGSGAFLVESCRQVAEYLVKAYDEHQRPTDIPPDEDILLYAQRQVAQHCLYGVDKNPFAVDLGKLSLWLATLARDHSFTFLDNVIRHGDSLVGFSREQISSFDWKASNQLSTIRAFTEPVIRRATALRLEIQLLSKSDNDTAKRDLLHESDAALDDVRLIGNCLLACSFSSDNARERMTTRATWQTVVESWLAGGPGKAEILAFVAETLREGPETTRCFHWEVEFPEVFHAAPTAPPDNSTIRGFHAMVGNPPWVSYAGKAAQPIDAARRRYYMEFYEAFAGYRNLQGLFVERVAMALRPRGRLGLVLPSSMAELDGYGPCRTAHSRLAVCDRELPDFGEDSFRGVSQPSMALYSTARPKPLLTGSDEAWPIERPDVDGEAVALLEKFAGPPLPGDLFGERGLQTSGGDTDHFCVAPDISHVVALRVGSDIRAFRRGPPSIYADPGWFAARLRPSAAWQKVRVLIRQTARVPIAVISDGAGFRNSILAGFETAEYPATFLVAYLNSTPIRWLHYYQNRDARLGMPQVKIGHLRGIPALSDASLVQQIVDIGAELSVRNDGISAKQQAALDELVAKAFLLTDKELGRIRRDADAWS